MKEQNPLILSELKSSLRTKSFHPATIACLKALNIRSEKNLHENQKLTRDIRYRRIDKLNDTAHYLTKNKRHGLQEMNGKNHRRLACSLFVFILLFSAAQAAAQNWVDGQIAIIEDKTGLILPQGGMCDNMLFANPPCMNHAAAAFYAEHPDNYDMLMFFTPQTVLMNMQMGFPVQKAAEGIGLDGSIHPYNPAMFGSAGRLRQCVKMGTLSALPNNPGDLVSGLLQITGTELMAHEIGHQWLAWIMVDHNDGQGPLGVLRGFESDKPNGHWSCWFNNHGSVMYGGNIEDNGDGTYTDHGGDRRYSQLDQYLMGLRSPEEVDPMFYIKVDGTNEGCASVPVGPGGTRELTGPRVDFGIEDIIRANGPRNPATDICHIKIGFAIVYSTGFPPSVADIAKVENYRQAIEAWWPEGTDGRGSLDTRLDGCGTGTEACPGEVSPQCGATPDGDSGPDGDGEGDTACTFNDFRCADENTVEICNDEGQWTWLMDCQSGQTCIEGECTEAPDGDAENQEEDSPDGDQSAVDGDQTTSDGDWHDTDGDPTDGDQSAVDGDSSWPPTDGDSDTANGDDDGSSGGCGQSGMPLATLFFASLILAGILRRKNSAG